MGLSDGGTWHISVPRVTGIPALHSKQLLELDNVNIYNSGRGEPAFTLKLPHKQTGDRVMHFSDPRTYTKHPQLQEALAAWGGS